MDTIISVEIDMGTTTQMDSNLSRQGMPPVEAAAYIVELTEKMSKQKASGLELC